MMKRIVALLVSLVLLTGLVSGSGLIFSACAMDFSTRASSSGSASRYASMDSLASECFSSGCGAASGIAVPHTHRSTRDTSSAAILFIMFSFLPYCSLLKPIQNSSQ